MEDGYCGVVCWEEVRCEDGCFDGETVELWKQEKGGSLKSHSVLLGVLFWPGKQGRIGTFGFFFLEPSTPYFDELVFPFWC